MYAKRQPSWTFAADRLYGVSNAGEEVPLEPSGWFEPYGPYGISEVLTEAGTDRRKLDSTLHSLLSWYEVRRGPPIRGVRAYRIMYSLSPQLDPRKHARATVLSRVLLAEAAR